jgi:hypothetical protein
MLNDDAVVLPFSAAERELLAELDDVQCTCTGEVRPVHRCPPCAARLIERLRAEIVSLQVIANEAVTATNAQIDSGQDGGAREHAQRLLCEYFRAAFVGAGLTWRETHNAGVGVLLDCLVEAAREARTG